MRPQLVLVGVILVLFIIFLNSSTFFSPNYSLLKVEALQYANYFFYPENYHQIELPKVNGPESFAFDCHGKGPYTGVSDGRVLKWEGPISGWKEFAITSPNRPRDLCDGSTNRETEPICGRPLGLKFNPTSCDLYIADAYFGLVVVGPNGGVAQPISTSAEGVPFVFTNALDIDTKTGVVYFTDSSAVFQRREWESIVKNKDETGRLMQYDPRTNKTTVLLKGLAFANGVALSNDRSFLLLAESTTRKILKLRLLRGQRAPRPAEEAAELFALLGRGPDNIKSTRGGQFWVGLYSGRAAVNKSTINIGKKSTLPAAEVAEMPPWIEDPVAVMLDGEGSVVGAVDGRGASALECVSEAEERAGSLWFGSAVKDYVGVMIINDRNIDRNDDDIFAKLGAMK